VVSYEILRQRERWGRKEAGLGKEGGRKDCTEGERGRKGESRAE